MLGDESAATIHANFTHSYEALYSRSLTGVALESVSWRVLVSGPSPTLNLIMAQHEAHGSHHALKGQRPVYFPELADYVDCPVYDRYLLRRGASFPGPAILEERESTLVVGPKSRVRIDPILNAIVELE
jgi:N-methylhydantoinase A